MPSREDPFGEYDHLKPVPVKQAAEELKEASQALMKVSVDRWETKKKLANLDAKQTEAERVVKEKTWLLQMSALAT